MLAETSVFTGSLCRSSVVVPAPWGTVSAMGTPQRRPGCGLGSTVRATRQDGTPKRQEGAGPGDGRLAARSTTRLQAPDRGRGGSPRRRNQIGTRGHDAPGPDAPHATPGAARSHGPGRVTSTLGTACQTPPVAHLTDAEARVLSAVDEAWAVSRLRELV